MCVALPSRVMIGSALRGVCGIAAFVTLAGCSIGEAPKHLTTDHPAPAASGGVTVMRREPLLPTYPCSRCHAGRTPDPHERKLTEFHTQKILHHGTQKGWCYRCHTPDDIDHLHLPDGTKVSFDEAYELCGSCHGDKLRDWQNNNHGLTTGFWLGERVRRSCPACHDPHNPHFPLMTPEHVPQLPRTAPASAAASHEESHGQE